LVEVLVVITIIALLGAIGYGTFLTLRENAKVNETELIIEAVASAMEARANDITTQQRMDVGIPQGDVFHPGDGSDGSTTNLVHYISGDYDRDDVPDDGVKTKLDKVVIDSADSNSFISEVAGAWVIVDAWDNPIRYTFPGNHNNHDDGFDLESAGPDEMFTGTNDKGNDATLDNIILE